MSGWTEGATPRSLVRADCHEWKGVGHAVQTEALDGQRVLPPSGAVVVACRRRAGQVSCDHTILRRGVGGPGAEGRDETRNHGCGNDGLRGDHCHPSHAKSHLFDPLECFRCPPEGSRRYRVSTETVATTPTPRPRQPTGPVPRAARVPRPTVPPSRREPALPQHITTSAGETNTQRPRERVGLGIAAAHLGQTCPEAPSAKPSRPVRITPCPAGPGLKLGRGSAGLRVLCTAFDGRDQHSPRRTLKSRRR